jgi:hypothetical protein
VTPPGGFLCSSKILLACSKSFGVKCKKTDLKYLKKRGTGMDIQVGDIVTLKKQHPCGSKEWEVLRVGMDFRLKCMGCDHQVMIPRKQVEKNIRQINSTGRVTEPAE